MGKDFAAFSKMIEELNNPNSTDSITGISFEPEHRKIRRKIQSDVDSILDKHFPRKINRTKQ